jgi:hypothetical protein
MVPAEDGIGNAINETGVFAHECFELLLLSANTFTGVLTAIGITAILFVPRDRRRSAQDHLSCHHASALTHEDHPDRVFVREYLWKNVRRQGACGAKGKFVIPSPCVWREDSALARPEEADSSLRSE